MIVMLGWMLTANASELDEALLEQSLPDAAAAVALSGFVGFGAGHVYAGDEDAALHTVVQLFGLGAVVAAPILADNGGDQNAVLAANIGGIALLVGGRLVECATVPRVARRTAEARLRAFYEAHESR